MGSIFFKDGTSFQIKKDKFTIHENFNPENMENDIALIKIPETGN